MSATLTRPGREGEGARRSAIVGMYMTEENLARQAELALERQGDYDALFFEGRWHSSGSLADRAARFAAGLADLGVRPGDRLLVLMANCPEVLITYSAAWRAGAAVTPLIFLVSEEELERAGRLRRGGRGDHGGVPAEGL